MLAETRNNQVLPTHSFSVMHNFVDRCYICLNYLFSRLKSPCILSCPMFRSFSMLLIIFVTPSWTLSSILRDEDQSCTQDSSPGSSTEIPSCTVTSPALFFSLLLIIFSLYCCWALSWCRHGNNYHDPEVLFLGCHSHIISSHVYVLLCHQIYQTSVRTHMRTCTGIFNQVYK